MGSSSLGRGGDYPSVAPCYALASPSFLASASKAHEALGPGPLPSPRYPAAGAAGGCAESPECLSTSSFWVLEQSWADSPAPRLPSSAPKSCHPATALRCALGLPGPDPRAALVKGRGSSWGHRYSPRPWSGAARRRMSGAWAAEESCSGGCVRPCADPGPRGAMPPALARSPPLAPRSLRPPPVAPGTSTRPPPPRLSRAPRCVPIPAPTSAVVPPTKSGDRGGQTRASPLRSASRPPPSYSHTPPPWAASLKTRGAAHKHLRQELGVNVGRQGGPHPVSKSPSPFGAQQPLRALAAHPQAPGARAPLTPAGPVRDAP